MVLNLPSLPKSSSFIYALDPIDSHHLSVFCFVFFFFLCIQLLASTVHELESHRCRVRAQGLLRRLCFRAVLGAGNAVEEAGPCPSNGQAVQPRLPLHGVAAVWGCALPWVHRGILGGGGLETPRPGLLLLCPCDLGVDHSNTRSLVSQTCLCWSGVSREVKARAHRKIFMIRPVHPKGNQP